MQKNFGVKIMQRRTKMKLSREKLAEYCEIGAVHLRLIETGHKSPSLQVFISICEQLQISPNYLLEIEDTSLDGLNNKINQLTPKQLAALEHLVDAYLSFEKNEGQKYEE